MAGFNQAANFAGETLSHLISMGRYIHLREIPVILFNSVVFSVSSPILFSMTLFLLTFFFFLILVLQVAKQKANNVFLKWIALFGSILCIFMIIFSFVIVL